MSQEKPNSSASPGPWRWAGLSGDLVAADDRAVMTDGRPFLEADATIIASAPDMLALLRELEWAADEGPPGGAYCPSCKRYENFGPEHAPDCRLGTLLDRLGRE